MQNTALERESDFTEALAVGSEDYCENIRAKLGIDHHRRKVIEAEKRFCVKEPSNSYNPHFDSKNTALRLENTVFWDDFS